MMTFSARISWKMNIIPVRKRHSSKLNYLSYLMNQSCWTGVYVDNYSKTDMGSALWRHRLL